LALPEDHATRLRCYRNALRNWSYRGYVQFKPRVEEWLANHVPAYTLRAVAHELHRHIEAGGEIREIQERRPEYTSYEFHYDLRIPFGERYIYFETVLLCEDADDPDDPVIVVVSVHDV
jgi:hypothetical protein